MARELPTLAIIGTGLLGTGALWWIRARLVRPVPTYLAVVAVLSAVALILIAIAARARWIAARDVTFTDLGDDECGFLVLLLDLPDSYIGGERFDDLKRMRGWSPAAWNAIEDSLSRKHGLIDAVYGWKHRGQGDPVGWELTARAKRILAEAQRANELQLPDSWTRRRPR